MTKAFQTNSMPMFLGRMPGLNSYGQISNMAWCPRIVAKTASYTVKASESGTVFHTVGASGTVTFTLPAIADGPFEFTFLNGADQTMTVAPAAVDTLLTFNDAGADSVSFATTGEKIGGSVKVYCDGTTLMALARVSKAAQTVTVAT